MTDQENKNGQGLKLSNTPEAKVDAWVESWKPYNPERIKEENKDVDPDLLQPVKIEESKIRKRLTLWFFIAFLIFMGWAFYAPIDAGVTAQGQVVVSGYRKMVQHPSGGVVREILINEGDFVKQGQVLIRVNPLNAEANLGAIESEYISVLAHEARLRAERLGSNISWPKELGQLGNKKQVQESKLTQEQLYQAKRQEYVETIRAREEQQKSLVKEEKNLAQLAQEGLVPRSAAEQAKRNRLESEATINTFKTNYLKQIETEMAEAQKRHQALKGQLEAARFDQQHMSIRAPATGFIIGLKVFTEGGVITAGQTLAEILPKDGKLVVDVKLPANVIDRVKKDALVDMHFAAFNAVTTPVVPGKVLKVGLDRVIPDKTKPGEPDFEYYPCQVEATPEGVKMLGELKVQPGMPVDVVIKTGERTFMSYVMKPITDRLTWAFK